MIFRISLIILNLVFVTNLVTAQKKKDLLLKLEQLEQRIQQDSLRLVAQQKQILSLNKQLLRQETNYTQELQAQKTEHQLAIEQLEIKLRNKIEVYDLYSFGYHPLRNSKSSYIYQLKESQRAIIEARKNNVLTLRKTLRTKQIPVEEKELLVQKFNELYQFQPNININQLTQDFSPKVEQRIQNKIRNKTQEEFIPIIRENLWIQALEENWSTDALQFLHKY
ncbi:MAG: hypothetical protein MK212_11190 [Saprospiraceae bacterium]|nr:hypothetical protein [Saprospiraceae bacterium]